VKINKQNNNGKEVSIVYGDDNSINVNIFNNKIFWGQDRLEFVLSEASK